MTGVSLIIGPVWTAPYVTAGRGGEAMASLKML
jgi:hypothetical protein